MTHSSEAAAHSIAADEDKIVGGAWLGPAIGAAVLTIAWGLYLVPVFFGILAAAA